MIGDAATAMASIKVAFTMAKGIASLKSETEINQAVIEIQRVLLEAQAAAAEDIELRRGLNRRIEELEAALAKKEDWASMRARYVLTQHPAGPHTYELKPEFIGEEVAHRLCATCFEDGRKVLLQSINKHSGGEIVECPSCKNRLMLAKFETPRVRTKRPNPYY